MDFVGSHCCSSRCTFFPRSSSLPRLVLFSRRVRFDRSERFNRPSCRINCTVSASASSAIGERRKRKGGESGKKVKLNLRLDHQVEFGEHVAIFGSSEEIGSWKKKVPLTWTENGWVCELELSGGQVLEYKFVIIRKDGSLAWESGDNRVLQLPDSGSFAVACRWDATREPRDLPQEAAAAADDDDDEEEEEQDGHDEVQIEKSTLAGQWQGKDVSFMRSNEHPNREVERIWNTTGLEGSALKLVEGDRNARIFTSLNRIAILATDSLL